MLERLTKVRGLRAGSGAGDVDQLGLSGGLDSELPPVHDPSAGTSEEIDIADLQRHRDELQARVAELQWDLGGLVYEMATRDRIRVDILVKRAAVLQEADAELAEVERILRWRKAPLRANAATAALRTRVGRRSAGSAEARSCDRSTPRRSCRRSARLARYADKSVAPATVMLSRTGR